MLGPIIAARKRLSQSDLTGCTEPDQATGMRVSQSATALIVFLRRLFAACWLVRLFFARPAGDFGEILCGHAIIQKREAILSGSKTAI